MGKTLVNSNFLTLTVVVLKGYVVFMFSKTDVTLLTSLSNINVMY